MDGHREYIDSETWKYNGNVLHVKKPWVEAETMWDSEGLN